MKEYGSSSELDSIQFRTETDNKVVTIDVPVSLTGASNTFITPAIAGTTDTLTSRVSTDQGANRLKNKDLDDATTILIDADDITRKANVLVNPAQTTGTTVTITLPITTGTISTDAGTATLTGKTIDGDDNTVQDLPVTAIKTVLGDANKVLLRDASGVPTSALLVNINVGSAAAIAYSKLALTGSIVNADVNASAAIAYSKLALTGSVVNADIATAAAIAYSKLALTGSIVNADIATGAAIAYAKLNLGTSIVNADINASAAIAYSKLALSNSIVNADINTSAAIAYSKLALATSIVNADISASAAIAYSKLNLATSIVDADIAAAAAIARTKLASGTANHVIINDGTGVLSSEAALAITRGGTGQITAALGYAALSPLTTKGDVQTYSTTTARLGVGANGTVLTADSAQTTGLSWTTVLTNPMTTLGDIIYGAASGVPTRLATGTANQVLQTNGAGAPTWVSIVNANISASAAIAYSKLNLATSIVDADINASAAIAGSKLAAASASVAGAVTTGTQTFAGDKTLTGLTITGASDCTDYLGFGVAFIGGNWTRYDTNGGGLLRRNGSVLELSYFTAGTAGSSVTPVLQLSSDTTGHLYTAAATNFSVGTGGANAEKFHLLHAADSDATYWENSNTGTAGNMFFIKRGTTSGTFTALAFSDGAGTTQGTITCNTTANTTAYNTSSDARLKTNLQDYNGAALIKQLNPVQYERFSDPGIIEYGLIAQEASLIVPQAVQEGGEDLNTAPWLMDYSKLVGVLVKAVKELVERIEILEGA